MKFPLLLSAAATMLVACATPTEFSYLNGQRWIKVELNTYDTQVVSVDGFTRRQNAKLFVEPGVRTIVLEAPPAAGFTRGQLRDIVVNVEPCMQYWFEAKRTNPLSQDWEPRVNYSDSIAGCKTQSH
jgi:hypothetical protein